MGQAVIIIVYFFDDLESKYFVTTCFNFLDLIWGLFRTSLKYSFRTATNYTPQIDSTFLNQRDGKKKKRELGGK